MFERSVSQKLLTRFISYREKIEKSFNKIVSFSFEVSLSFYIKGSKIDHRHSITKKIHLIIVNHFDCGNMFTKSISMTTKTNWFRMITKKESLKVFLTKKYFNLFVYFLGGGETNHCDRFSELGYKTKP